MSRRKNNENHIRKLVKTGGGGTYAITLPIDLVRELGWRTTQRLSVTQYGDGILIKDWKEED